MNALPICLLLSAAFAFSVLRLPALRAAVPARPANFVFKLVEYYEYTFAASDHTRFVHLIPLLAAHRNATNAQMPTLNTAYDPVRTKQTGARSPD